VKHDLAKDRPSRELLEKLIDERGVESVMSTKSPTYKARVLDASKLTKKQAIDLMLEEPNLIRRPLVLGKGKPILGYQPAEYDRFSKMIPPAGMAIAAITVMLWILWSDTLRAKKPSPILYAMRVALYLIVAGVLILNLYRYPWLFLGATKVLTIVAAVIGILGAGYFAMRLVRRPHLRK